MSVDDDQPEVLFRAKLQRDEVDVPWGFRLQGGVEFDTPLTVLKVASDSVAARCGLRTGDIVVRLSGQAADAMTHLMAQQAIANCGKTLEIVVQRAEMTLPTQAAKSEETNHVESAGDNRTTVDNGIRPPRLGGKMYQTGNSGKDVVSATGLSDGAQLDRVPPVQNCVGDTVSSPSIVQGELGDVKPAQLDAASRNGHFQPTTPSTATTTSDDVSASAARPAAAAAESSVTSSLRPTTNDMSKHDLSSSGQLSDDAEKRAQRRSSLDDDSKSTNIPLSTARVTMTTADLLPVEPLIKTDGLSRDYLPVTSDGASDCADDRASEISDDTASVIEMPLDCGEDSRESAATSDSSTFDDDIPEMDAPHDIMTQSLPDFRFSSAGNTTPTGSESITTESFLMTSSLTAVDRPFVSSSHLNINVRGASGAPLPEMTSSSSSSAAGPTTTRVRRDFSQTAPWRVAAMQRSLSASVGAATSYSDPDIASSSAAAMATEQRRRFVPERVVRVRETVPDEQQQQQQQQRERQQPQRVRQRKTATIVAVKPETEVVSITTGQDAIVRGSSTAEVLRLSTTSTTVPPVVVEPDQSKTKTTRIEGSKPTPKNNNSTSGAPSAAANNPKQSVIADGAAAEKTSTTGSGRRASETTAPVSCYIPQRPPPLPLPDSELVKPLRSVKKNGEGGNGNGNGGAGQPSGLASTVNLRHVEVGGGGGSTSTTAARPSRPRSDGGFDGSTPSTTAADLVDIRLPAVREMVADLNSRVERVEGSPLGQRYDVREAEQLRSSRPGRRRSSSGSDNEREIIIDTPPAEAIYYTSSPGQEDELPGVGSSMSRTERLLSSPSARSTLSARSRQVIIPTVSYHGTIVYSSNLQPAPPLSPRSSRRYSLPTGGSLSNGSPRKVRFADPPESSVVEIESRRRRRFQTDADDGRTILMDDPRVRRPRQIPIQVWSGVPPSERNLMTDEGESWDESESDAEYSSVSSLSEKLDRIELENALASAAMRRSRPFQPKQQPGQSSQWEPQLPHRSTRPAATSAQSGGTTYVTRNPASSLEPIQERVVPIHHATPTGGDNLDRPSTSFYRQPLGSPGDPSTARSTPAGFSVSIGPAAGGRLSLSVHHFGGGAGGTQRSSSPQISVLIPSGSGGPNGNAGTSSPRGQFSYTVSNKSSSDRSPEQPPAVNYSLPPSYEESIRVRNAAAGHYGLPQHPRSPSLQDFGGFPAGRDFGRISSAAAAALDPASLRGRPAAYSQTLQVDTGARMFGGPRPQPGSNPDSYTVYQPASLRPADRLARLEQVRGRPQSGDLPPMEPFEGPRGRSSSPLILAPIASRPGAATPGQPPLKSPIPAPSGGRTFVPITSLLPKESFRPAMTSQPEMENDPMAMAAFEPQSMPWPMNLPDSSMSGILAFLDKTFMEKALGWQTQSPEELRQSETYKLVREMDNEQRRHDNQ